MTPVNDPPNGVMTDDEFASMMGDVFGRGAATGDALSELDQARLGTATGRRQVEQENIVANISRLQSLREKVSPTQQRRIDGLIKNLEQQLAGWTRPTTAGRDIRENVVRGAAVGVVNTAPALADLALAIPDILGVDAAERGRSALRETMELNRETIDPQGAAGLAGEIGGGAVAGAGGYGSIARGTARGMAALSPTLRNLLLAESRLGSAAGNVAAGLPINLLQATGNPEGLMSPSGGTEAAIGIGADAIFGAMMPGAQFNAPARPRPAAEAKVTIMKREAEIAASNARSAEQAAARKADADLRRAVRTLWENAHPGEDWTKLPKKDRESLYNKRREEVKATKAATTPAEATPPATPTVVETPTSLEPSPEQIAGLRQEIAITEAKAARETNPEAKEDLQETATVLGTMLARLEPMVKNVDPNADKKLNPLVQELLQKNGLKKQFEALGIPFDRTKSVEQLWDELTDFRANNRKQPTLEELEGLRPTFEARASESPAHARGLVEIDAEIARLRSGAVSTPPTPSSPVLGHPGANAGPSGSRPAAGVDPIEARLAELKAGKRTAPQIKESPENIVSGKIEQIEEYIQKEVARMEADSDRHGRISLHPTNWREHFLDDTNVLRAVRRVLEEHAATLNELKELVGDDAEVLSRLPERWQNAYKLAREYEAALMKKFTEGKDRYGYDDVFNPQPKYQHLRALEDRIWGKDTTIPDHPGSGFKSADTIMEGTPINKRVPKTTIDIKKGGSVHVKYDKANFEYKVTVDDTKIATIFRDPDDRMWYYKEGKSSRPGGSGFEYVGTSKEEAVAAVTKILRGESSATPHSPSATEPKPSPTATPAVAVKPLTKQSVKQLNKRDEELLDILDKLAKDGKAESPEYVAAAKEMQEITAELNRRDSDLTSKSNEELIKIHDEGVRNTPKDVKLSKEVLDARAELVRREQAMPGHTNDKALTGNVIKKIEKLPKEQKIIADAPSEFAREHAAVDILVGKPPSSLNPEQLDAVFNRLKGRLETETDPAVVNTLQARLSRTMKEIAKRQAEPPKGPDGQGPTGGGLSNRPGFISGSIIASPETAAFIGGFVSSYVYNDDEEPAERLSRSFMWGLTSAGSLRGAKYLRDRQRALKTPKVSNLLPNRNQFPARVVSQNDPALDPTKTPLTTYLRRAYAQGVRGTFGLRRFMQATGKHSYPAELNPSKLADMGGRYIARTEQFTTGGGRLTYELDGEPIPITNETFVELGVKLDTETGDAPMPLAKILKEFADDDVRALGDLAVAYASLEGAGRGAVPMAREQAEALIRNADDRLVRGVRELRKYNMALMITAHKSGRLSLEGLRAMGNEEWYTPFQYLLKQAESLETNKKTSISQPDAIKGRKGGMKAQVLNPYDVTVAMTRRILRANEIGMILNGLVDHVEALPQSIRSAILEPITKNTHPRTQRVEQAIAGMRQVANMSEKDAAGLLAYIEGDDVMKFDGRPGVNHAILKVFRNGQLMTYRLKQPEIYEALKSLQPTEIDMFYRFMGMPARIASKGVVYNPIFITRMAFIDTFQAFLGSKYGFRPGIDNVRGLYHALRRTPEYKRLLDVGGPATIQSLSYVDPGSAADAARTAGEKTVDRITNNLKELKVVEAYRAIAVPFAEAARVGEYLRALDHGASTLEAAYAAWDVVGNPRMQGSAASMRAFHQMTLFSRPAMAALDKLVVEMGGFGMHPVEPEYSKTPMGQAMQNAGIGPRTAAAMNIMTKGFVSITLPSLLLWYINKDDEEIKQLRQTETGQLFWFVRMQDGSIAKIRKPHVIGELFGSSAEAFADQEADGPNSQRLFEVLNGIFQDASVNTLPQLGVITYGLWANKAPGLDAPIVPRREEELNPSLRGYDRASLPARIIADALDPVSKRIPMETMRRAMSPAGIDYVVRNIGGMLGEDAMQSLGAAIEYSKEGYVPPKDEAPVIGRLFARYPSMNVQPIQDFYRRDARVFETARSLTFWAEKDPTVLMDFWNDNAELITLVELHKNARQRVANYRRAIQDIRDAPVEFVSRDAKRRVEQQLMQAMITEMKAVNSVAAAQREAVKVWQAAQERP